jgi:hypothetical protein
MKQTNQVVKMDWRGYQIEVPAGTAITHQTALGYDENYNFVNDFSWIPKDMPLMLHDAIYYGINIPKEYVSEITN